MSQPLTFSTISDFGDRIVIHRINQDPTDHRNILLSLGDAWRDEPMAASHFAAQLVTLLNKAEYESNKD